MKIKINFSGHSVDVEGFDISPLVGINLPTTADELVLAIRNTLSCIPDPEKRALEKGASAEIILPGMAHAAAILMAEWHGKFGSFPNVRWAVRGAEGFAWPDNALVDLQGIRDSARTSR